jgi:hypothetical protein
LGKGKRVTLTPPPQGGFLERNTDMYKVYESETMFTFVVKKGCDKCGKEVRFDNKFCGACGSPLDAAATKDIEERICVDDELHEVGKACIAVLAKKYGVRLKDNAYVCVRGPSYSSKLVSASRHNFCCGKCGTSISEHHYFCTECGSPVSMPGELTTELSWLEVEAVVLAKFYEQNPELRPVHQEQKYFFSVAVYRKWNGSADFANKPFIFFSAQATKDKVHGIADLTEEVLDGDGEAAMLVEPEVGAFFKDCIENRWLYEGFLEENTCTLTCSLGDKHEFLIVVSINEIK